MSTRVARRHRRHDDGPEDHENHERWLLTYADMITLLMVLFIVLFAISQVDLAKFQKLKDGLRDSFGNKTESGVLSGQEALLDGQGNLNPQLLTQAGDALAAKQAHDQAVAEDQAALTQVQQEITARLTLAGLQDAVQFRLEQRGLVVTIVTDQVLFDPGSDVLTDAGSTLVDEVAAVLVSLPNPISVEGHTDNQPIATARFASNWELSTARATSVLRAIAERHGVPPERLSAAGYADTRAVASNDTPEGRAANRRVEIVVHSMLENGGA